MPNMNDPVIYVNRDITKRVKGIVSFEDFTNRMSRPLLSRPDGALETGALRPGRYILNVCGGLFEATCRI